MMAIAAVVQRRMQGFAELWKWPLADARGEAIAAALLLPLLLAPVIWNGFPIIYYDTGAYIFEGLSGRFVPERSAVYSLFLRFAGAQTSLWFIVTIQSALSAFMIVQCARAVAPGMRCGVLVLIAAALTVLTGLPWYIGQIEPDCFAALLVLVMYLLAFHASRLGIWRASAVAITGAFSTAVHPSHILLAGILLFLVVILRLLFRFVARANWPKPRLVAPAMVCACGVCLVVAGNFYFTRQVFVSRAGAPFVFARMLQDGIVMKLLDDTCPKSGYRLCAYKNALPPTADGWLWTPHSPFFALGHFTGTAEESARIVRDAIVRYPLLQLRAAVADSAAQFVRFRTGDQIEPQEWVLAPVLAHFIPAQMPAYFAARQQKGAIDFRPISKVHVVVGSVALAGLVAMLVWSIHRRRREDALLMFVLAALIGNAIICGVLSGPHDRYQSRLIWLAPFALALAIRDRISCPVMHTPGSRA